MADSRLLQLSMIHYPVMVRDVLKGITQLGLQRQFQVADCNFGLGGHSNAILQKFPNALITSFEIDPEIINQYRSSTSLHTGDQSRLTILPQNFSTLKTHCQESGRKYDVVLADLGYNSLQLEKHDGFSWKRDTPLDMRYSKQVATASELINSLSSAELSQIIHKFGDLSLTESRIVGAKIFTSLPITTTHQLRDCVVGCFQQEKTKKIAQVFQALRICVNSQLKHLRTLCLGLNECLNPGALAMIITFHSLQRDVVHQTLKSSPHFSKVVTSKPSDEEIGMNSRSQSAKMLSFRKIK